MTVLLSRILYLCACAALLLASCTNTEKQLKQRANELCAYIPDHELLEKSRYYMTSDFYAVLDTMFHLPYNEDVIHEWEFWFVATDGTPVARCANEILSIEQIDDSHIIAQVLVQPEDTNYEADEHRLYLEQVNDKWLIADYDEHRADATRYIQIWRQEY